MISIFRFSLFVLLFVLVGFAQAGGPDPEVYTVWIERRQLYDRWGHPIPNRLIQLEQKVDALRKRYPDEEVGLIHLKILLLVEKGEWQQAEQLVRSEPQLDDEPLAQDVLSRSYWRRGEYIKALSQGATLKWLGYKLLAVVGALSIAVLTWVISLRVGDRRLLKIAWMALLVTIIAPLNGLSVAWVVSSTPFPIRSFDGALSDMLYRTFGWSILLGISWILLRKFKLSFTPLPKDIRRWIMKVSLAVLVIYALWYLHGTVALYGDRLGEQFALTMAHMSWLFILNALLRLLLGDVTLGIFYVLLCYRTARQSLGMLWAASWVFLLSVGWGLDWLQERSLFDLLWGRAIILFPSMALYEVRPSWISPVIPNVLATLLGAISEGLRSVGQKVW